MPLFVDYTNHRNERRWRQVLTMSQPFMTLYPPTEALLKDRTGSIDAVTETIAMDGPLIEAKLAYCVKCMLVDRDTVRVLKLSSIHGFHEGPAAPNQATPVPKSQATQATLVPKPQATPQATSQATPAPKPAGGPVSAPWFNTPRNGDGEILARLADCVRLRQRDGHTTLVAHVADVERVLTIIRLGTPSLAELDFSRLRRVNLERQNEWDPSIRLVGDMGHLYRANELAGEVGEVCNVVKKLVREAQGLAGSRSTWNDLCDELADAVICCDLLAADYGIDLGLAVIAKFNMTSRERKLDTRL